MKSTIAPCSSLQGPTLAATTHRAPIFNPVSLVHAAHHANSTIAHRLRPVAAQANEAAEPPIENLNRDYCNDFVCTSSPAVESTVRALARDLIRANGVLTRSLFSNQSVTYKGFRSFTGIDNYKTLKFVPKYVTFPTVHIVKLRMLDTGNAEIKWRLQGSVQGVQVDVDMTTNIEMNLLTGQIEKHTDEWDLQRCSPPAAAAFTLALLAFRVSSGSAAVVETTNSVLDSIASFDDDDGGQISAPNPNDPMKFFQQKDSFKEDAIFYVGVLMLAYFMWQAWAAVL